MLRRFYYSHLFSETGKELRVKRFLTVLMPKSLKIGSGVSIGRNVYMVASGGIEIGDNVGIGPNVMIFSNEKKYEKRDIPIIDQGTKRARVIIEDNCWIDSGAIVKAGTHLGKGSMVKAGAIVEGKISSNSVIDP